MTVRPSRPARVRGCRRRSNPTHPVKLHEDSVGGGFPWKSPILWARLKLVGRRRLVFRASPKRDAPRPPASGHRDRNEVWAGSHCSGLRRLAALPRDFRGFLFHSLAAWVGGPPRPWALDRLGGPCGRRSRSRSAREPGLGAVADTHVGEAGGAPHVNEGRGRGPPPPRRASAPA